MTTGHRSTLRRIVESHFEENGPYGFSEWLLDRLDEGDTYDDITFAIRSKTHVPVSSRTVRRWADTIGKDAA